MIRRESSPARRPAAATPSGRAIQPRGFRPTMRFVLVTWPLLALPAPLPAAGPEKDFSPEALAFYDRDVLPILKANCYKCHADGKAKGNFSLATRAGILKGGDLGPAVSLDRPDESSLLMAVHYKSGLEMPPTGKLKPDQIE